MLPFVKSVLADAIKDLEIGSISWIAWVGLNLMTNVCIKDK